MVPYLKIVRLLKSNRFGYKYLPFYMYQMHCALIAESKINGRPVVRNDQNFRAVKGNLVHNQRPEERPMESCILRMEKENLLFDD